MHPDVNRLVSVPLFDGLDGAQLERIASWLEVEEYATDARITFEGASGYAFFVIDRGTARAEHAGLVVGHLEPGDVFGELAMLRDGRRHTDVIAETDLTLLSMFGTHFREMQVESSTIAARLEELARSREAGLDAVT